MNDSSRFLDVENGLRLHGQYRIERILGEGGMGTVYIARQLSLEREVALKVAKRDAGWQADTERRFLAEAQLAARIGHPNVVRVLDSGSGPAGLFIVYELVEGESLRAVMDRGLSLEAGKGLMIQACEALDAIHAAGVIHRDIKPDNMLVARDGALKLTDLGIAKDLAGSVKTSTGLVFGTPSYMSPEQCRGRGVGPGADVYSLGVVLYELATGTLPFTGDSAMDVLDGHLRREPERPSNRNDRLTGDWDEVILRSLQKEPEHRYKTAGEMGAALAQLEGGPSRPMQGARVSRAPVIHQTAQAAGQTGPGSQPTRTSSGAIDRPGPKRAPARTLRSPAPGTPPQTPADRKSRARNVALGVLAVLVLGAIGLARLQPAHDAVRQDPGAASATPPVPESPPAAVPPAPGEIRFPASFLREIAASFAAERRLEAEVSPCPRDFPGGGDSLVRVWAEVFVVDATAIPRARLEIRTPRAARTEDGPASPKAVLEDLPGGVESPLGVLEESASKGAVWSANISPSILHDGLVRFRVELPSALAPDHRLPMVALEIERPPAYVGRPLGGPTGSQIDPCEDLGAEFAKSRRYFSEGDVLLSMTSSREWLKRRPDCISALQMCGLCFFAAAETRLTLNDGALSFLGSQIAHISGELQDRPLWDVEHEAERMFNHWLSVDAHTEGPWGGYCEWLRRLKKPRLGVRAGRWSVLVNPGAGGVWCQLGCTESKLAESQKWSRRASWRREAQEALLHQDHGLEICRSRHSVPRVYEDERADTVKLLGRK